MDYEKLIRRLRNDADAYRNGKTLGRAFADQEDVLDNAATALSTLQAENEKLKNKLSELAHLPFDEPGIGERTRLMAENESLRAEVEHWKNAHHQAALNFQQENRECNKVLAELEQARAEITRLKYYEDKCHDCPIVCAKTEIIKAHEELEQIQSENDRLRKERDAAVDCIYKIEDALDRGNDNDWAREHISEWESQKED